MINLIHRNGIYSVEFVSQFLLVAQLKQEAGIPGTIHESEYDKLLTVAGRYGYGLSVKDL